MRKDVSTHPPSHEEKRHRIFENVIDLCDSDEDEDEEFEYPRDIIARQDKEYEEALRMDLARINQFKYSVSDGSISDASSAPPSPLHQTVSTTMTTRNAAASPVPSAVLPTDRRARAALFAKAFEKGVDVSIPARI